MPVTYTNRKGRKYYLCQGVTKSGKPRYYFSREQKGEPLEEIPDGYEIRESVNGIVSLSKIRPKLILDREIGIIKSEILKHPHAKKYPFDVKSKEIIIYEQSGPDLREAATMLAAKLGFPGMITDDFVRTLEKDRDIHTDYTPIMKFILSDKNRRLFRARRMCYLGNINDWIDIEFNKPIDELASAFIPTLGTDDFYELY